MLNRAVAQHSLCYLGPVPIILSEDVHQPSSAFTKVMFIQDVTSEVTKLGVVIPCSRCTMRPTDGLEADMCWRVATSSTRFLGDRSAARSIRRHMAS